MQNNLSAKNIAAIIIGNAFEWYDYFIYSFVSIYLAKLFFPSANEVSSLLAATATFGSAFLMRPLGGIILGRLADKYGRVFAMNWSIAFMSIALSLISFAPTYQQIGLLASLLLVISRLLQGFSAGGEFGISAVYLMESAPPGKRGIYCSLQTCSQMMAVLLSVIVGIFLTKNFSTSDIESFAWRIPFLIGLLIFPVGIYIRRHLKEIVVLSKRAKAPLTFIIRQNKRSMLIVFCLVGAGTVFTHALLSYMPTYVTLYLKLPILDAYYSVLIGGIVIVLFTPVFGWLSDCLSRKNLLLCSMLYCLIAVYPCFLWLNGAPSSLRLIIVQCTLCFPLAIYYGAIVSTITEIFPYEYRTTCLSISFNFSILFFGAFSQFINTYLIHKLATPLAITIYPLFGIVVSLIAALFYQENSKSMKDMDLRLIAH
jgi:MHS family proline/betaine transporter-like MFS transporter